MSDSTDYPGRRPGRGSLLDHAGAAPSSPVTPREPVRAPSRPAPSLLAAAPRSARLSTSGLATHHDPAHHDAQPSPPEMPHPPMQGAPVASNREKFGDRITRLIGTITPEGKPRAAPAEPEPPHRSTAEQAPPHRSTAEQGPRDPAPRIEPQPGHDDHYHWHAASQAGGADDGSRPLLDASILISAVWRYRRHIAAATMAGAVLGVVLALSTPHTYYAESRLFVDPREIRVTEDDVRNQQLSTEAMLAITDSQLQILSSTSVLEKVIDDLGLKRDPEFNGSLPTGGISGGLTLIKEIFTGAGGSDEAEQKSLEKLRNALTVSRDAKTFVLIVGVNTRDAEKSALIANQIVETYLDSEGEARSSLLERTSESIDTRLNALRSDLDTAEREVERFKAENGLVGVGGQYIDDKVILALSDQLAGARAMKIGIKVKAENLARLKPADVLSGAFPEELLSANLTALRKQYTDTRSSAEALSTSLGPKHPQYIAAQSALSTISAEISAELRRIVASSQTELQRAVETEQELASQMAVAKNRAMDQSVEFVTLRELERKANATRGIYEAFLSRSRETSERSNLSTRNIRVISPAEAPLHPSSTSRKLIAVGSMIAGFVAGVSLALLAGAVESIRSYTTGPMQARGQARFQTPRFGGYAPDPGPRTPPAGGPSRRSPARRADDATAFEAAADRDSGAFESAARAFADPRASAEPARPDPARAQTRPSRQDDLGSTPSAQLRHPQAGESPDLTSHHPAAATGQPLWSAYPAGTQPNYHPGAAAYAPVGGQPGYDAPRQPMAPQPQMMPPYPPYSQPQAPRHQPVQHQAPPYWPQPQAMEPQPLPPYPVQPPQAWPAPHQPAPYPMPHPVWPQAAPIATPYPAAPGSPPPGQAALLRPDMQPAQVTANQEVERIKRNMDRLKSRINGYGSARNSS